MKKIEAILKPFQIDSARDALTEIGVQEIIISDVRCSYARNQENKAYLSDDYVIEFLPKIKIEFFISAENAAVAIEKLRNVIATEEYQQNSIFSKIFVADVNLL